MLHPVSTHHVKRSGVPLVASMSFRLSGSHVWITAVFRNLLPFPNPPRPPLGKQVDAHYEAYSIPDDVFESPPLSASCSGHQQPQFEEPALKEAEPSVKL